MAPKTGEKKYMASREKKKKEKKEVLNLLYP